MTVGVETSMMSEPEDETRMKHPEDRSVFVENAVWLITGCSTGLGRQLAKHVLEHGYRTVVTARNPQQVAARASVRASTPRSLPSCASGIVPGVRRLLLTRASQQAK